MGNYCVLFALFQGTVFPAWIVLGNDDLLTYIMRRIQRAVPVSLWQTQRSYVAPDSPA